MPLADINPVLDEMLTQMKAAEPSIKTAEIFGGQFTGLEAGKLGFKSPAVFVAPLGGPPSNHPDPKTIEIDWRFIAYVVAKGDRGNYNHSREALNIAQAMAKLIKNNRWVDADVRKAELSRIELLYTNNGIAIWSIQWNQPLKLAC